MKEEDVLKFLAVRTHLGGTNLDLQMKQYIHKRKRSGIYIINLKGTWEKLLLAPRAIVAIENPADVKTLQREKEEQAAAEKAVTKEEFQGEWMAPAPEFTATWPEVADWSEGVQLPSVPIQQFPTEDWSAQPATEDWSAAPASQATEWVATTTEWSEAVLRA
ncbi:40S ribosomal protein SA [Camelus dromedarius]|uniref:40S ribosomal protein SA n=1 Tax=Camelus dromedarius TaxID=9838 RepID=A0A5N4E3T7_CAMDR|nr:40S ribosomal protein SA [Camelus dromedarius]